MPAHFGEIRPRGLTLVISHMTSPAQPSEKLPRCIRCQSLAEPLSELYWHIGDTTTRLGRVRPRSVMGENRTLVIFGDPLVLRWPNGGFAISRNPNRRHVLFCQPPHDLDMCRITELIDRNDRQQPITAIDQMTHVACECA